MQLITLLKEMLLWRLLSDWFTVLPFDELPRNTVPGICHARGDFKNIVPSNEFENETLLGKEKKWRRQWRRVCVTSRTPSTNLSASSVLHSGYDNSGQLMFGYRLAFTRSFCSGEQTNS
ncbi:hypothetical protein JTE90_027868 [Oedothorax gibbosus]|uniref:Uncharacterized protein n=1 Tax=Oedothorax gibbosus TaxID=931172 RepID=A0AAV6U8C0_9ARAC|nr:hypothetical protein JTE90_027868 [Oedothorax gibbosus]